MPRTLHRLAARRPHHQGMLALNNSGDRLSRQLDSVLSHIKLSRDALRSRIRVVVKS